MLFSLAAGHRDNRAPGRFCPIMSAESASEQPVAVRDVHLHAGASTGRTNRACNETAPRRYIISCVPHDGGFTRGARGSVNSRDLLHGDGEKAKWIRLPKMRLGRAGKVRQVLERLQISRMHPGAIEFLTVDGIIAIRVLKRRPQSFQLKFPQLDESHAERRFEFQQALFVGFLHTYVPLQAG